MERKTTQIGVGAVKRAGPSSVASPSGAGRRVDDTKRFEATEANLLALAKSSKNDSRGTRRSKNQDAVKEILESLNTKPKFTKMVEYSVECLKNLAVDEVSVEEMIDEGVIETMLKVLRLNPFNEKITELINKTLLGFCKSDKIAEMIGRKMGGAVFVNSLKKHKEPETLLSTCKLAARVAIGAPVIDDFVKEGMVESLATTIKKHGDDEEIVTHAIVALDKIAAQRDYAQAIVKTDVVDDVLRALRDHQDNPELCEAAVSLIAKLASTSPEIVELLKKKGAGDAILQTLDNHPDNEKIVEAGAIALRFLSGKEDMVGFKVAPGNNLATAQAMQKVSSLALVPDNVDYLVKNEGVEWILNTIKNATGDQSEIGSRILTSGCRSLQRVALDEQKIFAIMNKGGVKILSAVIDQHIKDPNVAPAAVGAMAKLVTRVENANYIIKANGIKSVIAAFNAHPDDEKMAKSALDFISRTAAHESAVPPLVDQGAVETLVSILKKHPDNPDLVLGTVNTLGRLATSAANVNRIAKAGGLEALVDALNANAENLDVAKQAILLIETAAMVPENAAKLKSIGAVDAILKAVECHPDDVELQQIAARALGAIAGKNALVQAVENLQKTNNDLKSCPPGRVKELVDRFQKWLDDLNDLSLVEANRGPLVKAGAVKALIDAWENAGDKLPPGVSRQKAQATIAKAMGRLATDPEGASQILKSGILGSMVQAATQNPGNDELAEAVMQLLSMLAPEMAKMGMAEGKKAVDYINMMVAAFPDKEMLLRATQGYNALLAAQPGLAPYIMSNTAAAQTIVAALLNGMNDPNAVLSALQAVSHLATDDASIHALVDAGIIDAILQALKKYADSPEIVEMCVQCLCQLCIDAPIATEIGDKGGCPLLIQAMRTHYASPTICEVDMVLLDSLASIPANAARMLEPSLQTVELVKWIMDAYKQNSTLVDAGTRLLETLQGPKVKVETLNNVASMGKIVPVENLLSELVASGVSDIGGLLQQLRAAMGSKENMELLLSQGALQQLGALMVKYKDNENIFYQLASAFAALAELDRAGDLLEDPDMIKVMSNIITPQMQFAAPMDLNDLTRAVGAYGKMKMKSDVIDKVMLSLPVNALLDMILESDDDLLLANAARLLGKVSNNDAAAQQLAGITDIRALIAAMRRNIENQEFLKYGVYLLGNLAFNQKLKTEIGREGGVQLTLQIMEMYPGNEGLIEHCAYTLAALSFEHAVNNSFIVACDGIRLLLNAMQMYSSVEDLLEHCLSVLCNLCGGSDSNKEEVLKAGGAQAVVETILNNFNAVELVITAFRTLGNLAYNDPAIGQVVQAGAVQALVAGMTVHQSELEVLNVALRVLGNLATDLSKPTQKQLAEEGAIQAVVEVVAQYKDDLDMELTALDCLSHMVIDAGGADLAIKQGGAEACLATMSAIPTEVELITLGVTCLCALTLSQTNVDILIRVGTVEGIIKALKDHKTVPVTIQGLNAFGNLAFSSEVAGEMARLGVVDTVTNVIKENMKDPAVLCAGYQALGGLCRNEQNSVAMADIAMQRLVLNLRDFTPNDRFLMYALSFLGNLCVCSKAAESVLGHRLVAGVVTALNAHSTNPHLMIRGLRALENIANSTVPVKEHMKKERVIEACREWIRTAVRDDVKIAAEAVIDAINRKESNYVSMPFVTFNRPTATTTLSARNIFGDGVKEKVKDIPEAVRNFLQAGKLLQKHSKTAVPRQRHVYMSQDMKWLIWKDPHIPGDPGPENKIKMFKVKSVETGRCTPQLERKRLGKFLAKEECAFSVIARNRTVDLEADNEANRDLWVQYLTMVMEWNRAQKANAKSFDTSVR